MSYAARVGATANHTRAYETWTERARRPWHRRARWRTRCECGYTGPMRVQLVRANDDAARHRAAHVA